MGFHTGIEIADRHGISEEVDRVVRSTGDRTGYGGFGELGPNQNLAEDFGNGAVGFQPDIAPTRLGFKLESR